MMLFIRMIIIILKVILNLSISIFWYFLLITNLLVAIKNIKENNNKLIIPIGIYTIGFFIASLLVEVSPRYFMPLLIPILLYSFNIFKNKPTRE